MPAAVSTLDAFTTHPGFIRRFCSCGADNRCVCGRPRAVTGWSIGGLMEVRRIMRLHHSLAAVVVQTGRSSHDCNIALNALMGRTPAHALAALEAKTERRP